jgi:glycosyltransferase involved in cell wall biosynthesis
MSIRVLHIIDHMRFGGAQRIVVTLASHQPFTKIYSLRKSSSTDIAEIPAEKLYFGVKNFFALFVVFPALIRLIEKEKIDVVHCHLRLSFFIGLLLALYFRGKYKPKFVFHEHGSILFASFLYKFLMTWVVRFGVVVTCSQFVKDALLRTGASGDIRVILNFVDESRFSQDDKLRKEFRCQYKVEGNEIVVGFAGRLVPQKGCYELVQAYSKLPDENNLKLMIAGQGSDGHRIQEYIQKHNLSSRVELLDYVSDMNQFYNGIDIFVVPSLLEPLGMVQLEAQMCRKPVIASDIPGIRETVDGTNALLFPVGDIDALAAALKKLVVNKGELRSQLGDAGRMNVSRFLLPGYLDQVSLLYDDLLKRESHAAV